jgi:hypothetical protein
MAESHPILKEILVAVSATAHVRLQKLTTTAGFDILKRAFSDHMRQKILTEKVEGYFHDEMSYAFRHMELRPYKHS